MNISGIKLLKLLTLSLLLSLAGLLLLSLNLQAQSLTVLDNGKLRAGNGQQNSINTSGNLEQLFYYNGVQNLWRKLTYSVYPLDNAFAVGGDKTNEWNINGTIVQNPVLSNQVINTSRFVATGNNKGYGTIISRGNIEIAGARLEIENTYTLPQNSAFIEVKVKVKNIGVATAENVRLWMGTRDDYVGNSDRPRKQKGNLVNGEFVQITNATTKAPALKVSTGDEGILFYTNSNRANTVVQSCCNFSNVINQNPSTSSPDVTSDGSYAFYVRMNDLPIGASDEFSWYYAAGELAELNEIISDVAQVSGSMADITSTSAKFKATSNVPATGYWVTVPRNAAAPTAAQIKAGTNYNNVIISAQGSGSMAANVETTFNLTGLTPATNHDFYFVSEDATPQYSEVFRTQFATKALPTISEISSVTVCQDASTPAIQLTITDIETAAGSLTLTATSTNPSLIPATNITFGGSGENRTITLTPAAGQYGTATISVTVTDADGDSRSTSFTLTVNFNDTALPVVTNVTYGFNDAASDLSAQVTGTNLLWYSTATGGTGTTIVPTPATNILGTQEFWVSQTITGCTSARAKIMVTVQPLNTITGSATSKQAYFKQAAVVDENITITGRDVTDARVYVSTGFEANADQLAAGTLPMGITANYNATTGVLSFTGTATAAAWQKIFREVKFSSTSANTTDRVIKFILRDANGNAPEISTSRTFTYYKPATLSTPVLTGGNNGFINDATPTITGTAEPNVHVHIYNGTTAVATVIAGADGTWSYTFTANLTDGEHAITASATDLLGFTGDKSPALTFTVDTAAPNGYTVVFNTSRVDVRNLDNILVQVSGAETGTQMFYTITSNKGGTPVTGNGQVASAAFEISPLDLTALHDGDLTLSFYLQDAAGNKGATVTSQVVKIMRNIVSVTNPALVKVPIRSAFEQLHLPAKVEVTYATGATDEIAVTWLPMSYNGLVAGPYELIGNLVLAPSTTNLDNMQAKITVEVQPNKVPTGILLSATSFSPNITATEPIGTFTTTDADDAEHVYAFVNGPGDTHNHLFQITGDKIFLKSNSGLSGQTQFSIRVITTDPYNNTFEQEFKLTKSTYAKAPNELKIVNAFTPNNDGINDNWAVPELKYYNKVSIEVFDRSGVRIFHTTNPEKGWDGKDLRGQLMNGPFLYVIQVEDIQMVKKGVVTVLKK